jgi:hypothetical protein
LCVEFPCVACSGRGGPSGYNHVITALTSIFIVHHERSQVTRHAIHTSKYPKSRPSSSKRLQNPLCLIDFQSQIRRPPSIRMIRQHDCLVPFRKLCSRYIPLTTINIDPGMYLIATISAASRRLIFVSKPPLGRDLNPLGVFGIDWNRCSARRPTLP